MRRILEAIVPSARSLVPDRNVYKVAVYKAIASASESIRRRRNEDPSSISDIQAAIYLTQTLQREWQRVPCRISVEFSVNPRDEADASMGITGDTYHIDKEHTLRKVIVWLPIRNALAVLIGKPKFLSSEVLATLDHEFVHVQQEAATKQPSHGNDRMAYLMDEDELEAFVEETAHRLVDAFGSEAYGLIVTRDPVMWACIRDSIWIVREVYTKLKPADAIKFFLAVRDRVKALLFTGSAQRIASWAD